MVNIPDLTGKVALVTGGNAGIGMGMVKALAAHNPACIYLCSRKAPTAQALIDSIHKEHPKANIVILQLDLSSFDSVRKCAEEFNSKSDRLDLLFLNAGISSTAPATTKEGFESQFGVNHMAHALFTQLLMPKLLSTQKQPGSDVRVMLTASIGGHNLAPKGGIQFPILKTDGAGLSPVSRYGQSKLANILFARKLAEQYPAITTTSHHPGTVKSEIWGKASGAKFLIMLISPWVWFTGIDTDKGAETGIWCAVAPKNEIKNGAYYEPYGKYVERSKYARDQKLTDELWEWTNTELAANGGPGWAAA